MPAAVGLRPRSVRNTVQNKKNVICRMQAHPRGVAVAIAVVDGRPAKGGGGGGMHAIEKMHPL